MSVITVDSPVNATGAVPIPGFRLDRPYPGDWSEPTTSDPSSRWTLRMNVSTELYVSDNSITSITVALTPPPPGNEGALFGGTNNSVWQVPENITDTWRLVIASFDLKEMKTVKELNDREDGGCPFSVLSEACQKELRNRTHTYPESVYNVDRPGTGYIPLVENSKACEADGWTDADYNLVDLNQNFSRETNWFHSYSSTTSDTYKEYGSKTFPFMLIWARERRTGGAGSGTIVYPPIEDSHISFACVRADTLPDGNQNGSLPFEEGDVIEFDGADQPGAGDGSGGSGAGAAVKLSSALMWMAAAATMGLVL